MPDGRIIVVDLGKTLAKVSLWTMRGELIKRRVRANEQRETLSIQRLDVDATLAWVLETLASFSNHPIEFIVPVAHGAAVIGLDDDKLAFEPINYEAEPPVDIAAAYREQRDSFAVTGSPSLPAALNMGAQLDWLEHIEPRGIKSATLMPYAQYVAWVLTGTAVSEVTSLGCHTDLWNPGRNDYSEMAKRRGWSDQFAPMAQAKDVVGTLRPDIARRTGLSVSVKILAGLHDSNAALLAARGFAEIENDDTTVLSTGTWFVAMRLGKEKLAPADLPFDRDCLVNIDCYGMPVPSARFMGGREIETLIEIDTRQVDIKPDQPRLLGTVRDVVASRSMVLPTLAPGFGPYPNAIGGWVNRPEDWFARRAGACLYAALVADTSLDLIGAKGNLLVEGRFSEAEVFVRALATLRPDTRIFVANAHNDVSFGALRLIDPALRPDGELRQAELLNIDLRAYREEWLEATL